MSKLSKKEQSFRKRVNTIWNNQTGQFSSREQVEEWLRKADKRRESQKTLRITPKSFVKGSHSKIEKKKPSNFPKYMIYAIAAAAMIGLILNSLKETNDMIKYTYPLNQPY